MVVAVGAAAWLASPPPSALGARVASRLRGKAGQPVAYAEIPAILREAVATTEDERFYRLHGIDAIGVLPALASDVTNLSFAQGSTITEQPALCACVGA